MRYKQLRNYANRRNTFSTHVRRVRHLRDRLNPLEKYDDEASQLRFRLRKDSVSDLIKIFDGDTVLIALRCYTTGNFQMVIGHLFGVSVFAACRVIHKVSRARRSKNDNSCQSQGNWLMSRESFMMLGTWRIPSSLL